MPEPATILQSNAFKKDELVASLTGAGPLAAALTARIAAAKTKMSAANGRIDAAFSKLDEAEAAIESVAKKIETEADAAIAQVGQVSNLGS
jgi:hypothetical protein